MHLNSGISLGDVALDLGCGPGADLPGFAEAVGAAGRVIGWQCSAKPDGFCAQEEAPRFAEPDWDTLVIDYPDTSVARAYTRFVADRVVRNSAIGRQLVRLATHAGFEVRNVIPITTTFRDGQAADKVLGLRRVTERAVRAHYLTPESASQWLSHLAEQPFFASATLYIVTATAG